MSFDWSKYLDLAQELTVQASSSSSQAAQDAQPMQIVQAAQDAQDAKLRCAVSRAYYAAFCKARNHLRDIYSLPVPHDGSDHRYVKEEFKKNNIKERRRIGVNLERMKINRGKADYDDVVKNLTQMANENLNLARRVIMDLGNI